MSLSYETYSSAVDGFKGGVIYPEIYKEDFQGNKFSQWWEGLVQHAYDFKYVLENWDAPERPPKALNKKLKREPRPPFAEAQD